MWHLFYFLLTTLYHVDNQSLACNELLLLPQRYVFSSKSQQDGLQAGADLSCCCYHKGTYFQANHNGIHRNTLLNQVVVATTKVRIFKQITTEEGTLSYIPGCCCYHKGTYFQANHNLTTTIFTASLLLLLPQRYVFSSKSQRRLSVNLFILCCCCYHKGTYFQANHNNGGFVITRSAVVVATTKVRIFKQITTSFGAEHSREVVVVATTKVRIFKQITTYQLSQS